MKKLLVLVCLAAAVAAGAAEKRPLRVLMIGNSFSVSVMRELPKIVDAQDEYALDITSLYIGGCSLERHIKEYETAKKNMEHRPYSLSRYVKGQGKPERAKANLIDALDARKYDVVTIQQASPKSFTIEGWEPWGDKLVAIVREKQPQAKLLIHQTWSYRSNSPQLKKWNLTQETMFRKVREVVADRAKHFDCGVIPMGEAVQLWRSRTAKVTPLALSAEELEKYKSADKVPPYRTCKGDLVGCYRRNKRGKIWCDLTHLNGDGNYMQGCVWFAFLFGADAEKITYKPKFLTQKEAALIRKCAADAVAGKYE